ncbi:hypothetical protein V1514DRAFT_322137 [Lipomyces japonicus]|uniref:uncharacterized protein n=1 Tax=Lipomyces japonicus TaxID=56871 RepID=UPI0034CF1BA3
MGFLSAGSSMHRLRKRQKLDRHENKQQLVEATRVKLTLPSLECLPAEIVQKIFLMCRNASIAIACKRLYNILTGSAFLRRQMLLQLLYHDDDGDESCVTGMSLYSCKFVSLELVQQLFKDGLDFGQRLAPLTEKLCMPPYTADSLALFEYLLSQKVRPVNPVKCMHVLTQHVSQDDDDDDDEDEKDDNRIAEKIMMGLMTNAKNFEVDYEIIMQLLEAKKSDIVLHAFNLGIVNLPQESVINVRSLIEILKI